MRQMTPPSPAAPVLLIGGTRSTGLAAAKLLMQQGTTIRVLARDAEAAARRLPHPAEIVHGDITIPSSLSPAIAGASAIIFTAGARSGRPALPPTVRRTELDGVENTLEVAHKVGFNGRFMYMNAGGMNESSFWTLALNTWKGNTLRWRAQAEDLIRRSGFAYTIIRAGVLNNGPGGGHDILLTQRHLPLSPRYRIARADVAAVFVAALSHPRASRTTFDVAWQAGAPSWQAALDGLQPDSG